METRILIRNIVTIVAILIVAFLSQQPQFRVAGKDFYAQGVKQGGVYWSKAQTWFSVSVYPKIGGEVSKLQSTAAKEITTQKNNFVQSIWQNFRNYFAQKFSKTFGVPVQ